MGFVPCHCAPSINAINVPMTLFCAVYVGSFLDFDIQPCLVNNTLRNKTFSQITTLTTASGRFL